MKTEEDEAFEELSRKQGYWGLQGSRKHQILRYAENVESKGTRMTQEIIEMARQAEFDLDETPNMLYTVRGNYAQLEAFAKLVAEKEREACAVLCEQLSDTSLDLRFGAAIRARRST